METALKIWISCALLFLAEARSVIRVKRQQQFFSPIALPGPRNNPYVPYQQSIYNNPLLPQHPFEQSAGIGIHAFDGNRAELDGDLFLTLPDEDLKTYKDFDLKGSLTAGNQNFFLKFGETFAPVNLFNLPLRKTLPCAYGLCQPTSPEGGLFVKNVPDVPPIGIPPELGGPGRVDYDQ